VLHFQLAQFPLRQDAAVVVSAEVLHVAIAEKIDSKGSLTHQSLHRLLPIGALNLNAMIASIIFSYLVPCIACTAYSLSAFRSAW
jgi:hypothetical protein